MSKSRDDDMRSFLAGVLLGLLISAPLAAWFSPYSGHGLRKEIRQRGQIIVRRAEQRVQQVGQLPERLVEGVGQQVGQIQGRVRGRDEIDEALEEGRAIAARRRDSTPPARL